MTRTLLILILLVLAAPSLAQPYMLPQDDYTTRDTRWTMLSGDRIRCAKHSGTVNDPTTGIPQRIYDSGWEFCYKVDKSIEGYTQQRHEMTKRNWSSQW